jgi:hypothetical protein
LTHNAKVEESIPHKLFWFAIRFRIASATPGGQGIRSDGKETFLSPCGTPFPFLRETLNAATAPPGHTSAPVNASAVFHAPDQAKIAYDASAEATLSRYELRGTPGEKYKEEEDAITLSTRLPADARGFLTGFGLTQPGTRASYKVFVIPETGR